MSAIAPKPEGTGLSGRSALSRRSPVGPATGVASLRASHPEKPLASRTGDAERAVALTGNRLFVMDKWRYHPGIEALGALARSGELGPVRAMRTWRLGWGHSHDDVDPIWTLLPHDLSIVLEILGVVPPAVHAVAERGLDRVWGMTAHLGTDPLCMLEVSARRPEHRRRIEVVFETAVAVLDGDRDTLIQIRSDD